MRQALEMALEALEDFHTDGYRRESCYDIIKAIKEALAQPEQEPVACVGPWHDGRLTLISRYSHQTFERDQPLYTTPPQPEQRSVSEHLEPVAWIEHHKAGDNLVWDEPSKGTPLYTKEQL